VQFLCNDTALKISKILAMTFIFLHALQLKFKIHYTEIAQRIFKHSDTQYTNIWEFQTLKKPSGFLAHPVYFPAHCVAVTNVSPL